MFKQTSIFNVKSALANNQNLMQNETEEDQEHVFFSDSDISDTDEWDYLRGFWSGQLSEFLLDVLELSHCGKCSAVARQAGQSKPTNSRGINRL